MMKIIVMSDSHGDKETVKAIANLPADAHFHCGDSELSFEDPVFENMYKIRGNCDRDMAFSDHEIVKIGEKNILILHGHAHHVQNSMLELYYFAVENDAHIVLFGHTHLFGAEMKDGILFVNPGSTVLPRGGKQPTYAVIEWGKEFVIMFKNMSNAVVESISLKEF